MQAVTTGDTEVATLRRMQVGRLDALGHADKRGLRIAAACTVLAGWLLVPQAAAIAWAVQCVLVNQAAAHSSLVALCALLAVGLLRAALVWISRSHADQAVEAIRVNLRGRLIRRLFEQGPLWLRSRRSGELAELMGTHVDAMEGYFGGYRLARAEVVAVPLALPSGGVKSVSDGFTTFRAMRCPCSRSTPRPRR